MLALISLDMRPDSATPATGLLREEHRMIDGLLDRLGEMLAGWRENPVPQVRRVLLGAWGLVRAHQENEEAVLFEAVRREFPETVEKMQQQHAYSAELGSLLMGLLELPQHTVREMNDLRNLARQFAAITQHNMIEEERTLFRMADKRLSRSEQQGLYWQLLERRRGGNAITRAQST